RWRALRRGVREVRYLFPAMVSRGGGRRFNGFRLFRSVHRERLRRFGTVCQRSWKRISGNRQSGGSGGRAKEWNERKRGRYFESGTLCVLCVQYLRGRRVGSRQQSLDAPRERRGKTANVCKRCE